LKQFKLLLALILIAISITSCVQKSSKKTVVAQLNVSGIKDIKAVGLRGNEKPLSWDYDVELKPIITDTLYEASFSLITGYKFTECKFTINGDFELKDKGNRRIVFSEKDTTIYQCVYNVNTK
jgi:hypothetical protein